MDPRDLKEVDTLLGIVGKSSLFEYYEVDPHAEDDVLDQAVKKRRGWAQGQQANPKFRNEALWLIKHNALVRRVLVDHRGEYLGEIENRVQAQRLKELSTFIRGTLASGKLTPEAEDAIRDHGLALGLTEDLISQRIDEMLDETGISRDESMEIELPVPKGPGGNGFVNFYELLGIEPTSSQERIEQAHRDKYRDARNRRDKERASEIYAQLDEAWRVLHDPERRAEYDAQYRARLGGTAPAGEAIEFYLPPPTDAAPPPTPAPPMPRPVPLDPPPQPVVRPPALAPVVPELAAEEPPARVVTPPKPPNTVRRTIGMSPQQRTRSRPRLSIASPDLVVIKVGRKPVAHSFVIKNGGQGKMPGRVTSDREWVQVSRSRLDPDAAQQEVEVVIHPRLMPRNTGVALVTVVTDHGERRAITLRVERTAVPLPYVAAAVAFLVIFAMIVAAVVGIVSRAKRAPASSGASLEIHVDPTSDSVRINGRAVGHGDRVVLDKDLVVGKPMSVTAVLDGFEMGEQQVTLAAGESQTVNLELKLRDSFSKPGTNLREAKVDREIAEKALAKRVPAIEACLADNLGDRPGLEASVAVDIYFNSLGSLIFADFHDANFDVARVQTCVERQLRAVKFPAVESGDFGVLRSRTFSSVVTTGSG